MSFLKKFGSLILKATEIVAGIAPMISTNDKSAAIVNTISADLAQIAGIIGTVEGIGQALALPGAQKLAAAAPQVAQIILQSSLMAHQKIADPALFQQGAKKIADGMADVLNSLHENGVDSVNKA